MSIYVHYGPPGVATGVDAFPNPGKSEKGVTEIRVGSTCQGNFPASLAKNTPYPAMTSVGTSAIAMADVSNG